MEATCENSPWHREPNVGVHTNMVVDQYLTRITDDWNANHLLGAFACAFHDVGKPYSMEAAFSEERGNYYRFRGHELSSARFWEDWAVTNWNMLSNKFMLQAADIYRISWIIENHLPWGIKKPAKREMIVRGAEGVVGDPTHYINVLKADTWGRISDDQEEKRAKVDAWCEEFLDLYRNINDFGVSALRDDLPTVFVMIGASGTGKSTFFTNLSGDYEHFSLDVLRHDWYDPDDYRVAFEKACKDKKFNSKANKVYTEMLATGNNVVIDNVNGSKKRRAHYLNMAKTKGYKTVAVLLPVALNTILARQHSREDKFVPDDAVTRQYMTLSMPSYGEFDDIYVVDSNLR
jgi:predicted kinase